MRWRRPPQGDLRLLLPRQLGHRRQELLLEVGRVGRGGDGGHRPHFGKLAPRRQYRRAAQAVPHQQTRGTPRGGHEADRRAQILEVGREGSCRKVTAALTDAGEIEAQHADTVLGQGSADPPCGAQVLATGEAVGEQRIPQRLPFGQVHPRRQLVPEAAPKPHVLAGHGSCRLPSPTLQVADMVTNLHHHRPPRLPHASALWFFGGFACRPARLAKLRRDGPRFRGSFSRPARYRSPTR